MGSYQPQPLGLRRPKAQPRFFLQQGEQRILQGPQLLLEEGLPSSLHNCGPSAQTPFILVLDPTVSPPLPPFLFLHISFTFAVKFLSTHSFPGLVFPRPISLSSLLSKILCCRA